MIEFLVIVTIIGTIVWFLRSHRNQAELTFKEGKLTKTEGEISPPVLAALREAGKMTRCTGQVVIRHNDSLFFSGGMADGDQQRMRNAFYSIG
jgi:hypothetical protein